MAYRRGSEARTRVIRSLCRRAAQAVPELVAERLGRFDHQFEIGRLLDRHIGGLRSPQELDELPRQSLSKHSDEAGP